MKKKTDEKKCSFCGRTLVSKSKTGLCPDCLNKYGSPAAVIGVGGIMLGAGGLVRAYSHGAKIALDAGGIITMSLCKIVKVKSDYNFYGRLVPLICEEGGIVEDTQFTDNVEVTFRIPEDKVPFFESRLVDVSCGKFHSEVIDEKYCEI